MKKVFFVLFLILLGVFSYIYYTYEESKYYEDILDKVSLDNFSIDEYSIFGTHLNIKGCINKELNNSNLILKNKEEEIILKSIFYNENNTTCFYTSEYNNDGIYLDALKQGDYILLVKDNDIYYTLDNNTTNSDLEYYTITKDSSNNKINIKFKEYEDKNYVNFVIKKSKLPDNVYDISIDPGHGGKDPGAIGKLNGIEYYESKLTLKVSLLLKQELENMGLKVHMTRSEDIYLNPYGEGGRALLANDNNAKYSFSIHFNSSNRFLNYGGAEIYTPNDIDLTLSRLFASNLSEIVGYSKNSNFKIEDGVYYKYFKQSDIDESKEAMLEDDMIPFDIVLNCPYMYMIRELGGIHTYAYIDGRNDYYGLNSHYNSIQTVEPYLLELAYINYPSDLSKAVNNPELFSNALSKSIKEYLNIS